jgi:LmbE family N-acetylglucosaminyl deacetylase
MSVLIAVAHPDDEVLGAGGTIARLARAGEAVHIVFLADGVGARGEDLAGAARRAEAARRAAQILGAAPPRFLTLPDNRLDSLSLLDVIKPLEAVLAEIRPDAVYTHHAGDLNIDHEICHRAVLTACRPMPGSFVRRIYAMEVASSTEWNTASSANAFLPTRFVDIAATLKAKRDALVAYAEEMRPFPHARSLEALEALARWRGASAGLEAAEAFAVVREVEA